MLKVSCGVLVPVGPACAGAAAQHSLMQVQVLVWAPCFGGTHSTSETSGRDCLVSGFCPGTVIG